MISFLIAMVFVFFDKTNLATKVTLGAILGVLFIMIAALLYTEWDNAAPWSGFGIFIAELKKYVKWLFERLKKPTGDEVNIHVETDSTTVATSEPSLRSPDENESVSSWSQRPKRSMSDVAIREPRRWWTSRWWIFWRRDRTTTDATEMGEVLPTLPTHGRAG